MKRISEVIGKYMAWIVGVDRTDHRGAGAVCTGDMPVDPDRMDQLSADDRHVRNGTYDETV